MKKNQIACVCENCGKDFSMKASRLKTGRGKYCSQNCKISRITNDAPKRFYSRIQIRENGCHEYTRKTKSLYPLVSTENKEAELAHRYAWRLQKGDIPERLFVLHTCDNPKCCNIKHLFLGTQQDNMTDKVQKGRAATRDTKNGKAKLTTEQCHKIANERRSGKPMKDLASKYKVTVRNLYYIMEAYH